MLPGMPDALSAVPPKAREYAALTLDEAIAGSHALLDEVIERYQPNELLLLFSGGNDSSLLAHLVRGRMTAAVHIRTTIGVPQTQVYVEQVCQVWDLPLIWADPPDTYADLVLGKVKAKTKDAVVWRGFPGPGAHAFFYQRLKEKALDEVRRARTISRGRNGQIAFVAGTRWSESARRFRNAEEVDVAGSVVWVSPIVHWTNGHIAEYRARHRCTVSHVHAEHHLCHADALPLSEVSANLHMSGDCLCGAFAHEGELDEVEFFYPEVAARIRAIEAQARAGDIPWCVWGAGKAAATRGQQAPGRLCSSCAEVPGQADLLDTWVEQGLMTADQVSAIRAGEHPTVGEGAEGDHNAGK